MSFPFLVIHYRGHADRRAYLERGFAGAPVTPEFVTEFDREDFALDDVYRYDEGLYRRMIAPIKDVLIGYVLGVGFVKTLSFADCVAAVRRQQRDLDQDFQRFDWLVPRPLNAAQVSAFLKHRAAWQRLAEGDAEWGIIVEDDIIFHEDSLRYLLSLVRRLPAEFDYIDLVGGCGLLPRTGNQAVNDIFFEAVPPRERTACGALLSRSYARRLLALDLPICLPLDWTITYAMTLAGAKVYWLHPPVFAHGSDLNIYPSSTGAPPRPGQAPIAAR